MTEGCEYIIQLLASWSGWLGSGACAMPRARQGMEPAGLLWTWHYTVAWLLSFQVPSSHFPTSFPAKSSSLITPTWLFVLESASVELTSDKAHSQMIEKPCRLFASKKGNLLHMLNFKNQSYKLLFFRKRIWRRRRISGDPRHHQGAVRQIWVQSSQWGLLGGCQTSQGHCELWVWQQALCAQGPPPDMSSKHPISKRTLHFKQMFLWSGMHIYTFDTSKGRTWPLDLINQLDQL